MAALKSGGHVNPPFAITCCKTEPAPADTPQIVTWFGSPPNLLIWNTFISHYKRQVNLTVDWHVSAPIVMLPADPLYNNKYWVKGERNQDTYINQHLVPHHLWSFAQVEIQTILADTGWRQPRLRHPPHGSNHYQWIVRCPPRTHPW